uniref:Jupiter microtubule associated homolog 1b n=1 Tax=Cyprinus carpio TaxID=7962 RepID=A0A8C1WVY5_CYPCA
MTTTTNYQGMEPGAKNSSRVLRPPGGASNISFGTDDEKPVRKNKMASSIFAEPDDPHAHRRNNPPGTTHTHPPGLNSDQNEYEQENNEEAVEQKEEAAQPSAPSAANNPSGRRNPPGGKSSLILG